MTDDLNEENLLKAIDQIKAAKADGLRITAIPRGRILTRDEWAQVIYDTAQALPNLTPIQKLSVGVTFAQNTGGDECYRLVNQKFMDFFAKEKAEQTYKYTEAECPFEHKIIADWSQTSPYTLPAHIKSDGGCSEGCCDDFKCTECGYSFRIECPQ